MPAKLRGLLNHGGQHVEPRFEPFYAILLSKSFKRVSRKAVISGYSGGPLLDLLQAH